MASSVVFYVKSDSVSGTYPYVHKKITVDDVVVYDEPVPFSEIDSSLKQQYAVELASVFSAFSSSITEDSFFGNENMSKMYQLSRLLSTIAANIEGETLP